MRTNLPVAATEYFLKNGESIVCTTDLKGKITCLNPCFIELKINLQAISVFKLERSSSSVLIPVRFQPNRSLAQGNAFPWTEQARRSA